MQAPAIDAACAIDLEAATLSIGRALFARAGGFGDGIGWLDRRMMDLAMRDERVKAQLFRLVDVLPALSSPAQINRHLREYFLTVRDRLPDLAADAMDFIPADGDSFFSRMVARAALAGARRMARRFIAATNIPEAVIAAGQLRQAGLTFTVDVLGEAVLSATEAQSYQQFYLDLIERLSRAASQWTEDSVLDRDHRGNNIPKVNVSIKLSSLYSQFDPIDPGGTSRAVRSRLRPILRLAQQRGAFVNIDMEQYAYKDLTLRIFKEVLEEEEFRAWSDVGIAIQAYLRDCGADLQALHDWAKRRGAPVWVRLVKGAYWDYETIIARQNNWPTPVWDHKAQTDANYEAQAAYLIANHEVLRPAIASHNIRSIACALAHARAQRLPKGAIEFQMLFGMADPVKRALVEQGQRVRVYAPMGQLLPGMAYLVRRLLENTSNESFLRAGFIEHIPEEKLLMQPSLLPSARATRKDSGNGLRNDDLSAPFVNEPLTDFSRDGARRAMSQALAEVSAELGKDYPLVIGGRSLESGDWIESIDPSHKQQVLGRCAAAGAEHVELAVKAAESAFSSWRNVPQAQRSKLLLRVGDVLRQRRFELAAWQVCECGKPWREADGDVAEAIDYCEYYAREALRLGQGWNRNLPGEENQNLYEPRGVAVIISPWNFPLAILLGMTAAAIVTGNTAIMKPSEQSSILAAKLMEIFARAGIPSGVVNYLPGIGEEIGPALVSHPAVSIIAFTGSRDVGLSIQAQAAKTPPGQDHVKRIITEMGGKNAIIVDDDADLDEAVHGVVASAFGYAGQKCSACSRVIVLQGIFDSFLSRLVEATASVKLAPAEDPGCFLGPVIDAGAFTRIGSQIDRAKAQFQVVYAGDPGSLLEEGFYIAPHIFTGMRPDAWLAQEEIFGPVLAVLKAADLDQALTIANGTRYALTGGLYSRSPSSIDRITREFRVGNLYINRKITGALVDRQPFGGYKLSGIGSKAGGPDYLLQFVWPRTVTTNSMRRGFAPVEAEAPGAGGI